MKKTVMWQVLPVIMAVGLLWYVLKNIPLAELVAQFRLANYGWLSLVGLLTGLFYVVRAARWQLTLQAIGYQPSLFRATVALLAGSLASMIVPGAGELTRCGSLQRTDGIPISQGIGSVVAERIVDLFMLVLVLLLAITLELSRAKAFLSSLTLALPGTLVIVIGIVGLVGVSIVIWQLLKHPVLQKHPLMVSLIALGQGFSRGFMSVRQLPNPGLFIALTLLIQGLAWLSTYVLLLTTDDTHNLPPEAALTILAVSSLGGLAVPTQGGIGTYHFFVSRALILYGFTATQGAVVATFLHAVGFGFNLLLSSISFLLLPILIARKSIPQPEHTS